MIDSYQSMIKDAAFLIIGVILLFVLVKLLRYIFRLKWLIRRKIVCLELTPPAHVGKTPEATQKLFSVIHAFSATRPVKEKLLGRPTVMSLEVVSTKDAGIRYQILMEDKYADNLQRTIHSYLPEVIVKAIEAPNLDGNPTRLISFKQTGHYAFPLAHIDFQVQHDPAAYLAGSLTKLEKNETMRLQLVIEPVKLREASMLSHKILSNEDLLTRLSGYNGAFIHRLLGVLNTVLYELLDVIGSITHTSSQTSSSMAARDSHERLQVARRVKPARQITPFEQELMTSIHAKVSQPLFKVAVRAAITASSESEARARIASIKASLESYTVPAYQSLKAAWKMPGIRSLEQYAYMHRLPSFNKSSPILSASELANIYHFPLDKGARTDNLITSLSRSLPAPVSLKKSHGFDVILGRNYHHGTETDIGLTEAERERHVYIIGGTGNGKTTMLQYAIVQDMQNGKGLGVIDPHGDMAETLLRRVPKERIDDVVYFNPDDIGYPIGLNLLELPEGLSGAELEREKDLVTESVISVFRKIFSDEDTGGHRIEYVLRNTIQTALTVEGATLFTIFDLLNDPTYRRNTIKTLDNKDLINFWKNELGKAGEMQKVKMVAGITAKIGRFLFSASAKRILEQPKSTIDFDDIINSGKILICNFSKGLLGEDTSELFGITVLAKLQLASLRRARQEQSTRRPFYLYVDEFQNFATQSFVQMLSESRKYKLYMTMAEQSTSQQKDQQMVNIILANVGTVISFRTGNPSDERLILPLFTPYIDQGEIANLPAYSFYARLSAVHSQEPLSGKTLLLQGEMDNVVGQQVIDRSRKLHTKMAKQHEKTKPVTEPKPKKKTTQAPKTRLSSVHNKVPNT